MLHLLCLGFLDMLLPHPVHDWQQANHQHHSADQQTTTNVTLTDTWAQNIFFSLASVSSGVSGGTKKCTLFQHQTTT